MMQEKALSDKHGGGHRRAELSARTFKTISASSGVANMVRLADPHGELPIKNHKYVKNCTELYLAQRGIQKLVNFDAFVNLEVLWINDNEVRIVGRGLRCPKVEL
jgi:hypothetical protein